MYDVIVIGGGPSGLMAAISAGEAGAKVLLIDKGDKLGRKLAISGGGRCNVTNRLPVDQLIKHIPGNGRFLHSAFSIFSNEDIIMFFNKLGVQLKEEDHGRMFPVNNKAQSVVDALLRRLKELHITVRTNSPVDKVSYQKDNKKIVKLKNGDIYETTALIIAVGGKSVPQTGSTGDGYSWAKKAGHTITELFPTEVPVISNEKFIKQKTLQGLSLRDAAVSVLNAKGKAIVTHKMDMIFTHFGISGPAVLRCSQFIVKELKKSPNGAVLINIDIFPDKKEEALFQELHQMLKSDSKKSIKNIFKNLMPERYLLFLLENSEIDPSIQANNLSNEKLRVFVEKCKKFRFHVHGTQPIEKAFITGGGVSIKEIEPKTMVSKLVEGLYFCGEILDIHGYTGGFNITAAFVTGRLAGLNAAQCSKRLGSQ
ncbi:NAD(P)/FAD-dependent oxidoreductase [Niallia sp. Krafla_26]|uniref:NAD(P)/FAD-dependent oxidoreductase n=1 Tax=Niallia sp. Krafla_26 TaxID=3064703 RepID=UPI003D17D4E6